MDLASIISFIATFAVIFIGILLAGSPMAFVDPAAIFIVIGGITGTFFISYPMNKVYEFGGVIKAFFTKQNLDVNEVRPVMVSFAEKARREGLLALEDDLEELDDEFLKKGIQLVVDGTDPELVEQIMKTELQYIDDRHSWGTGAFDHLTAISPALGMIGTLIGLIIMLGNLDNPDALGPSMAVALITTFYGAVLGNVVFSPMSERLNTKNDKELLQKKLMIEGVLSIQSGDNPRIVDEKLKAFMKEAESEEEEPEA